MFRDENVVLSPPPSIEYRIKAAMLDEYPFQVVYYNRKEGASIAAMQFAQENENVVILALNLMKRYYEECGIKVISCTTSIPYHWTNKIIIADCLSDKELKKWRELIGRGNRIIALKGIRSEEGSGFCIVNNINLENMKPWDRRIGGAMNYE